MASVPWPCSILPRLLSMSRAVPLSYQCREITASVLLCPHTAAQDLQRLQLELGGKKESLIRKSHWLPPPITKSDEVQVIKIIFRDDLTGPFCVIPIIIVPQKSHNMRTAPRLSVPQALRSLSC